MKITGRCSAEFMRNGVAHRIELAWGRGALRSFPYRLEIDGAPVSESRVTVEHWWFALISPVVLAVCVIWFLTHVFRG
jgi:hypothetical protein